MKLAEKYLHQIETELLKWLEGLGFVNYRREFGSFMLEKDKYTDKLVIGTSNTEVEVFVGIQLYSRRIHLIESYLEDCFDPLARSTKEIRDTFRSGIPKSHTANVLDPNTDIVAGIVDRIKSDYYQYVLPRLDEYSNINKLDAIANADDKAFSLGNEFHFRKLVIAKLAGNKMYEEIYAELCKMYEQLILSEPHDDYYRTALSVIQKIHDRMKNVQSLVNPKLT